MPVGGAFPPRRPDPTALGTQVAELFREQISNGRWAVGDKIPTEAELVAWSGAGRNTVREAVSALVAAGMLRRQQGRGTFVLATSDLRISLERRVAATSRRDGLELRLALDAAAARIAAVRRTDDDAKHLQELLAARRESWTRSERAPRIAADSALHRAVVEATHNALLGDVYDGLLSVFEEVLTDDVAGEHDELEHLHADLVRAIVDGDEEAASHTMSQLLQPMIHDLDHP